MPVQYDLGPAGLDPFTGMPKKKKQGALDLGANLYYPDFGRGNAMLPGATSSPVVGGGGGPSRDTGDAGVGGFRFKSIADLLGNPQKFQELLVNDPTYKQTVGDLANLGVADAAQRDAGFRRGILQFGLIPDFNDPQFSGLAGIEGLRAAIDPATVEAANKFTGLGWSTLGQLNTAKARQAEDLGKALADQKQTIANQLAARGLTGSGEAIYQNEQLQGNYDRTAQRGTQDFQRAMFEATRGLTDDLAGVNSAYLAGQRYAQQQRQQAAEEAARRLAELLASMFPAGGQAATGPSSSSGGGGGGASAPPYEPPQAYRSYDQLHPATAAQIRKRIQQSAYGGRGGV